MNKINTTKKYIKIMFSVIISFILALTAIIPEYQIQAKEKVKLEKEYFFYVYPKLPSSSNDRDRTIEFDYAGDKSITAAESSDEEVFTVDEEQTIGSTYHISIEIAKVKKE